VGRLIHEHAGGARFANAISRYSGHLAGSWPNQRRSSGLGATSLSQRSTAAFDAEHMYYAAINSKGCKLTALGAHYRKLAEMKRL
jgi:hypothetical protein